MGSIQNLMSSDWFFYACWIVKPYTIMNRQWFWLLPKNHTYSWKEYGIVFSPGHGYSNYRSCQGLTFTLIDLPVSSRNGAKSPSWLLVTLGHGHRTHQQIIFGNNRFEERAANQPQKSKWSQFHILCMVWGNQKEFGPSTVLNPLQKE